MTSGTIYNRSGGPLVIDDEGRQLAAGDRLDGVDLDVEPVKGHVEARRLVVPAAAAEDPAEDVEPVPADEPQTEPQTRTRNRGHRANRQES